MEAVLLFPETSMSSFLINLPSFIPYVKGKTLIMDVNDYKRIIRLAAISKEYLFQTINIENLLKLGLLKLVDYRIYYSKSRIINNSKKINYLISNLEDSKLNDLTLSGYEGWLKYTKNDNKKLIYESLDETALTEFISAKNSALKNIKKLEHGGGDSTLTIDYIQRLLTRTMAANSIVESLNRRDHNVRFVVEGPEYGESINTLSKNKLINKNIFKHPNKISMNSLFEIQKLIDDLVPEILPNITGYNMSSFVVGSSIGSLMYLDIDLINDEINNLFKDNHKKYKENITTILKKIKKISYIEKYSHFSSSIDYIEEAFPTFSFKIIEKLLLRKLRDVQLSDSVYELKKEYMDSEILIAFTVFLDPFYKMENNIIYYQWWEFFMNIFRKTTKDDITWLKTQKNMDSWTLEKRWYEI